MQQFLSHISISLYFSLADLYFQLRSVMTLYFLVVLTHLLLSMSCKHFSGHFFSHLTFNMCLSSFYLQADHLYVPLLVGYHLLECTPQATANEGNSANSRGKKLRKESAAFPSSSCPQITTKQEVLKS